jgi:UDP-glucuronate decarboxylase
MCRLTSDHALEFCRVDVNCREEIAEVFSRHSFDFVFHYAALVGVRRTLENPVRVLRDIEGIRNVLDLSRDGGVRRVYYSSSSEVYGEPVHIPQHEHTTPLNSRLPYAVVKNVGEAFLRSYAAEFGLDYTVFRFFNTYGPGQSADFVVSRFIRAALEGTPLHIYGDGSQTRTFCYIDDNVEATLQALNGGTFRNDVVNIGSDRETTVRELAGEIIRLTGSSSEIIHLPPLDEGDMTRRKPDIARMKTLLGREPVGLAEGLTQVITAFRSCAE